MPNFYNDPPAESSRPGLRLCRTPASHPLTAIVTSRDLIGTPTHFHRNRTIPCEGKDCEVCAEGHSWRWHGYLACVEQVYHEHVLFEFTAQASEVFRNYRKKYGDLRGCLFQAARSGGKFNSRVNIQVKPANLEGVALPNEIDLIVVLCHIWNVPVPTAYLQGRLKDSPRIHIDPSRQTGGNNNPVPETTTKGK